MCHLMPHGVLRLRMRKAERRVGEGKLAPEEAPCLCSICPHKVVNLFRQPGFEKAVDGIECHFFSSCELVYIACCSRILYVKNKMSCLLRRPGVIQFIKAQLQHGL